MANNTSGNPIWADTPATLWTGEPRRVKEILWVDDAADIADNDDLVFSCNGTTITTKVQVATTTGGTPVENLTPNAPGLVFFRSTPNSVINEFVLTTIDHGALIIWID